MAKVDNVSKYSIYGLKRRPTYDEIIGMIDESNEKITGKLPNRDATFFKSSPEGSLFDGSDAMEQLKEEQGKLLLRQMSEILLRQNVRTAGRTFHTERSQQLPTTSPTISQPSQPMNVDEEATTQATPTMPSSNIQQASQLNAELTQRGNRAMKRKEETVVNHRGEMFKQNKPTLAEQMLNIQPPRVFPELISIATSDDDDISDPMATSSNQPMKRIDPETEVEPKGKRGRPRMTQEGTKRATPAIITIETKGKDGRPRLKTGKGEKRDGDQPEEEMPNRAKRTNKNREKQQMRLETSLKKAEAEAENETKPEPTKKGRGVKKNKMKREQLEPVDPKTIHIQELRNEFVDAFNKKLITSQEFNEFEQILEEWKKARGNGKTKPRNKARMLYGKVLYNKLKKKFEEDKDL